MPENNSEFVYNPSEQAAYDNGDPTDAELEAFAPEADEILREAQSLDLDHEAKRIRDMEAVFETINNPRRLIRRKRDVQHLKDLLTESNV